MGRLCVTWWRQNTSWVMSVDGTHIWIEEPPNQEIYSMDLEYFSQKFNKAGIKYKLGITLHNPGNYYGWTDHSKLRKMIWTFLSKKDQNNDFCCLERKQLGTVVIRCTNWQCHIQTQVTLLYGVQQFKSRALKRHESFNGMTKTFKILWNCFWYGIGKIGAAFESVAVICQNKIKIDEPLYDALIEKIVFWEGDNNCELLIC